MEIAVRNDPPLLRIQQRSADNATGSIRQLDTIEAPAMADPNRKTCTALALEAERELHTLESIVTCETLWSTPAWSSIVDERIVALGKPLCDDVERAAIIRHWRSQYRER
jgi:hypothetical protein